MGLVVATHAILFSRVREFSLFKGRDVDQLIPECVTLDLSQHSS
jgi:hypothetical protein